MKVPDTSENREKCLCPKCPSYPKNGEILYCSRGKSCSDINPQGCLCPDCPVWFEYQLKGIYYCDKEEVGVKQNWIRKRQSTEDLDFYHRIVNIKDIAATGESIIVAMGSQKKMPFSFDDLNFVPAQIHKIPLNKEQEVKTQVVIGPKAKKPLVVSSPIMVSGMSFGATSKNVRLTIADAAGKLKMGFNSGEGGILPEEFTSSAYLIGQYATGRFGVNEDILKKVAAVEIRFGQGAYPGKGSFLPADKVTPEIAKLRGLKGGEPAYSPAHHHDMTNPQEIKEKVAWLKKITDGVPVGAKIGCGNIEKDIEILVNAGVDFIAVDGFGGGTGATDGYIRDNVGLPLIAALPRASRALEKLGVKEKVSLIAGGGLRDSADFAKCLCLGADAVYIGTVALIAINCQQFRICHTGLCPTGVTTHDPSLVKQLNVEKGVERLTNFLKVSNEEVANLARVIGKNDINQFNLEDLVALKKDLAELTNVQELKGGEKNG